MAAKQSAPARRNPPISVEAFVAALDHPLKPLILALRQTILDADPAIAEAIKWNAPSFHTSEHFATFNLRARDAVQVILHLGAKPRATATTGITIADPTTLLVWLAPDRASASFRSLAELDARRLEFAQVIRQWIVFV